MRVAQELRRRILEYAERNPDVRSFSERLIELIRQIEREFSAEERGRLLVLAGDTFERHVESRAHASRARSAIASLRAEHERMATLVAWLADARRGNQTLH